MNGDHRFRHRQDERAKPGAETADQDHDLHRERLLRQERGARRWVVE